MTKRIIYTTPEGEVAVIVPSIRWVGTLEELAIKDVPEGLTWRIVSVNQLPTSRNYRDAWTDENPTDTADVDLERAKPLQRRLMVEKAIVRVERDTMGYPMLDTVKAEIEAIDLSGITSLDVLYNTFPASIDKRSGTRKYEEHV